MGRRVKVPAPAFIVPPIVFIAGMLLGMFRSVPIEACSHDSCFIFAEKVRASCMDENDNHPNSCMSTGAVAFDQCMAERGAP